MSTKFINLKFENHNLKLLTNGVENPEKIVLCMHGFNGDAWGDGFSKFRKQFDNILVCSYDSAGHGESEIPSLEMSVSAIESELEAVLQYLSKTYPSVPITIFASSYGAYRTMISSAHGKVKNVKQFIFANPAFKILNVLEIMRDFTYASLPENATVIMKKSLNKFLSKKFLDDLYNSDLFKQNYTSHIPTTIFLGTHDTLVPKQHTLDFAKIYPCNIIEINEDHNIENPESWQKIIDFINAN